MSADTLRSGDILRLETFSGKIYYCMWRQVPPFAKKKTKGSLHQYKPSGWSTRMKGKKPLVKTADEWYVGITSSIPEKFTTSSVSHLDFLRVLKEDVANGKS